MPTTFLEDSLTKARAGSQMAAHRVRIKASASIDVETAVAGQGGNLQSLITGGGRDNVGQNYQLIKDWVATCLNAICRRLSAQNYGAGEKLKAADAGKNAYFAHKSHRSGIRLPPSVKEAIVGGMAIKPFEDHEALGFLAQPNPLQGKHEFLAMWVMNLYASGEAFVIGGDLGAGSGGRQAWCLPTPWLVPRHEGKLFSSYRLKPPGVEGEGIPVPAEVVHRSYFPDPANLKKALCPLITQLRAIRIDESIQASQEQMFDKGIFPNVILEVGDTVGPDGKSMGKPVLTGAQRRQLVRAVREIWNATLSNGDPAIIDGLIKDIKKLNAMPAEMDWLQSGKAVKERVFQMFGLNPIIVGEIVGANRAQAAVADQSFIDNVINPLTDRITVMLNSFVAPMYAPEESKAPAPSGRKLMLWLEEATPKDDDLLLRKTTAGRTDGNISRNEARSAQGMPPNDSPASDNVGLASTAAGAAAITNLLMQVGSGTIGPESAKATLVNVYGLSEEQAAEMLGDTEYVEPPAPTIVQQVPSQEQANIADQRDFNPNQPRDEHGEWTDGGGPASGQSSSEPARYHLADHGTSTVKTTPVGSIKLKQPKTAEDSMAQLNAMDKIFKTAQKEKDSAKPHTEERVRAELRLLHAANQFQRAMGYARGILHGGKDVNDDLQSLLDALMSEHNLEPSDPDEAEHELDYGDSKAFSSHRGAKITRGQVKASHRRQALRLERQVASVLRPFFGGSTIRRLRGLLPAASSTRAPGTTS